MGDGINNVECVGMGVNTKVKTIVKRKKRGHGDNMGPMNIAGGGMREDDGFI